MRGGAGDTNCKKIMAGVISPALVRRKEGGAGEYRPGRLEAGQGYSAGSYGFGGFGVGSYGFGGFGVGACRVGDCRAIVYRRRLQTWSMAPTRGLRRRTMS